MHPLTCSPARALACLVLLLAGGCRGGVPPTVALGPLAAVPPGGAAFATLAFLTGCWRGTQGSGDVIEERWTPPAGQLMLSTTRFLRDDRVIDFEFGTLALVGDSVVLVPYPRGERSPHPFVLTERERDRVVFEAPEHDYPKRILYERGDDGTLLARIDAGENDPEPRSWTLAAASCP
jgi:hypothetical protein